MCLLKHIGTSGGNVQDFCPKYFWSKWKFWDGKLHSDGCLEMDPCSFWFGCGVTRWPRFWCWGATCAGSSQCSLQLPSGTLAVQQPWGRAPGQTPGGQAGWCGVRKGHRGLLASLPSVWNNQTPDYFKVVFSLCEACLGLAFFFLLCIVLAASWC